MNDQFGPDGWDAYLRKIEEATPEIRAIAVTDDYVSLIVTAKMNDVDPQAWLADVLARTAEHPAHRLDELLPWNWAPRTDVAHAA
jgi:hypothetical protein